jgi:hypothetical protein
MWVVWGTVIISCQSLASRSIPTASTCRLCIFTLRSLRCTDKPDCRTQKLQARRSAFYRRERRARNDQKEGFQGVYYGSLNTPDHIFFHFLPVDVSNNMSVLKLPFILVVITGLHITFTPPNPTSEHEGNHVVVGWPSRVSYSAPAILKVLSLTLLLGMALLNPYASIFFQLLQLRRLSP